MVFLIADFNDSDDHVVGKFKLRQLIYANSHPIEWLSNERRVSMLKRLEIAQPLSVVLNQNNYLKSAIRSLKVVIKLLF